MKFMIDKYIAENCHCPGEVDPLLQSDVKVDPVSRTFPTGTSDIKPISAKDFIDFLDDNNDLDKDDEGCTSKAKTDAKQKDGPLDMDKELDTTESFDENDLSYQLFDQSFEEGINAGLGKLLAALRAKLKQHPNDKALKARIDKLSRSSSLPKKTGTAHSGGQFRRSNVYGYNI